MWYKCDECGHIFEEGEQKTWEENIGECWGSPAYERNCGCPICEGTFEQVYPCVCCGELIVDSKSGYCDECVKKVSKKIKDFVDDLSVGERVIFDDIGWEAFI